MLKIIDEINYNKQISTEMVLLLGYQLLNYNFPTLYNMFLGRNNTKRAFLVVSFGNDQEQSCFFSDIRETRIGKSCFHFLCSKSVLLLLKINIFDPVTFIFNSNKLNIIKIVSTIAFSSHFSHFPTVEYVTQGLSFYL